MDNPLSPAFRMFRLMWSDWRSSGLIAGFRVTVRQPAGLCGRPSLSARAWCSICSPLWASASLRPAWHPGLGLHGLRI